MERGGRVNNYGCSGGGRRYNNTRRGCINRWSLCGSTRSTRDSWNGAVGAFVVTMAISTVVLLVSIRTVLSNMACLLRSRMGKPNSQCGVAFGTDNGAAC